MIKVGSKGGIGAMIGDINYVVRVNRTKLKWHCSLVWWAEVSD